MSALLELLRTCAFVRADAGIEDEDGISDRLDQIEEAENYLSLARAELAKSEPNLGRADAYMADAMSCLMVPA